jgi:hypothetical protein
MSKTKEKKRQRKRVAKEDRKNLRLWAEGVRETILAPHLDAYQIALDQGWREERKYLKKICREFHARVSWRMKDHEEPILAEWDPAALLTPETLTVDEEAARGARVKELNAVGHNVTCHIHRPDACPQRIRRWFTYRIRKLRKHRRSSGLDPTQDPYAVLLAKLSGLSTPPKARQAYQQFMRESYLDKIAPIVADKWQKEREQNGELSERTKEPKAGFRAQVARDVFTALPKDEQNAIAARAKKEAAEAKAAYMQALKNPLSKSPEDCQK